MNSSTRAVLASIASLDAVASEVYDTLKANGYVTDARFIKALTERGFDRGDVEAWMYGSEA